MSDSRSSVLPNLPAIGETYPGFNFDNWGGLMAPKGTPIEVIQVLNSALRKVLDKPDVKARMTAMGVEVKPSSPEELTELVRKQHKAWGDAIAGAGIEAQ
jgi:tripartite-type tricarboxylate transporter receptor subunit TctC